MNENKDKQIEEILNPRPGIVYNYIVRFMNETETCIYRDYGISTFTQEEALNRAMVQYNVYRRKYPELPSICDIAKITITKV
jgi:hypothetical protein